MYSYKVGQLFNAHGLFVSLQSRGLSFRYSFRHLLHMVVFQFGFPVDVEGHSLHSSIRECVCKCWHWILCLRNSLFVKLFSPDYFRFL